MAPGMAPEISLESSHTIAHMRMPMPFTKRRRSFSSMNGYVPRGDRNKLGASSAGGQLEQHSAMELSTLANASSRVMTRAGDASTVPTSDGVALLLGDSGGCSDGCELGVGDGRQSAAGSISGAGDTCSGTKQPGCEPAAQSVLWKPPRAFTGGMAVSMEGAGGAEYDATDGRPPSDRPSGACMAITRGPGATWPSGTRGVLSSSAGGVLRWPVAGETAMLTAAPTTAPAGRGWVVKLNPGSVPRGAAPPTSLTRLKPTERSGGGVAAIEIGPAVVDTSMPRFAEHVDAVASDAVWGGAEGGARAGSVAGAILSLALPLTAWAKLIDDVTHDDLKAVSWPAGGRRVLASSLAHPTRSEAPLARSPASASSALAPLLRPPSLECAGALPSLVSLATSREHAITNAIGSAFPPSSLPGAPLPPLPPLPPFTPSWSGGALPLASRAGRLVW